MPSTDYARGTSVLARAAWIVFLSVIAFAAATAVVAAGAAAHGKGRAPVVISAAGDAQYGIIWD